jgi:glyoxylase-like metal-dependent hydrolase (beta-lactamase superfamily II)
MKVYTVYPYGFGSNGYNITVDDKQALVIDPSSSRVEKELDRLCLTPVFVLLTHCHFDHVAGVESLQQRGAKVICSEQEKQLVGTVADLHGLFGAPSPQYKVDQTFTDGEELTLCGIAIKCLLTPGHTAGSACYFMQKEGDRVLFTGDTLFMDSVGRTDFPTGNLEQLRQSLKKLTALEGDMPVYAGHQEQTTLQREREYNPFVLDA